MGRGVLFHVEFSMSARDLPVGGLYGLGLGFALEGKGGRFN
jgi:hypothetical protein